MNHDLETSTRKVILSMLKTQGQLSVANMSEQLGVTKMAVRRHLNTMEQEGLLNTRLVHQPMGRPANLYFLTDRADSLFPKNYELLTLDLLGELLEEEGQQRIEFLFKRRESKLTAKYQSRMQADSLKERVSELVNIQNENGYMVDWVQQEEGFIVSEHNCPIAQVAVQFEQACQCELSLFQNLLDAEVERTECLAKGGTKCVYVIQGRPV
ncbi:helix-turn-helix transcriptional regulator [Paenibacillus eucommiae]|uniref:ArsR family transcriptional regulator n=1 Tax=Paenibacillus eucommiae TaxID=1355755 RepID=A0ABS4IP26_9BACL|nr:DeoR family transcriptional regulator [Paenibacillus eucommiae]MBP1989318.1 putative ArsR family transcriptional regulator [Paenibacillus eucommiae]